jgi:hypothetical protein
MRKSMKSWIPPSLSLVLFSLFLLTTRATANQNPDPGSPEFALHPVCFPPDPVRHETLNVELVDHRGGSVNTAAVQGDYAYVGMGARLVVLDVSNPHHLRAIGQTDVLPGTVQDLTVAGDYAYLAADEAGLRIIDIADPTSPIEIGFYDTVGAEGVAVMDHYAYVVTGSDYCALYILDVADPADPVLVGVHRDDIIGYPTNVRIYGNHAYVMASLLTVFDLANPISPTLASHLPAGLVADVAVVNNYAYAAGNGLSIFDVTDPGAPELTGKWNVVAIGSFNQAVAIAGNYAYLPDRSSYKLRTIDITSPYTPTQIGRYVLPRAGVDVTTAESYVYAATTDTGLYVLDAGNPANLSVTSVYSISTDVETPSQVVVGNYEYRVTGVVGGWYLQVLDISDPADPKMVGSYSARSESDELRWCYIVVDLAAVGDYAYVADSLMGLHVLNVMTPTAISEVNVDPEPAFAVAADEDYAYVGGGGLRILDVSDPTDLKDVGSYNTAGTVDKIALDEDYIYVSSKEAGLFTLWFGLPVSATIPPGGGTLTSPGDQTTYTFPSGLFTSTAVITHTPRYPGNVPSPSDLIHIGHAFEVTGTIASTATRPVQPSQPYTITIRYTETEKGAAIESSLALYYWNGNAWNRESTSVVDTSTNVITAFPDHFSLWAILGETHHTFNPIVLRDY